MSKPVVVITGGGGGIGAACARRLADAHAVVVTDANAGAAEMERNLTRERTRSALAVKKANGQRVGAIPYGYDLAPDGHTLIPNEAEQAVITEIRAMRAEGMRLQLIARTLSGRNIRTKTRKSGDWSHQAVARILARTKSCASTVYEQAL